MDKSAIATLFPSYLSSGSLREARRLNRQLINEIKSMEEIDDFGRDWSRAHYHGGYSSYSSMCKLHVTSPVFGELERALQTPMRQLVRKLKWDLLGRQIRMTTCWANSMGVGTYHTLHVHPSSVLSGVYFVDIPKNSSPFRIEDPRMSLFMAAPPRRSSAPAPEQNYILIDPRPGQFLIFESWMRHEVPPHRSEKRRLSVSFNYEWI